MSARSGGVRALIFGRGKKTADVPADNPDGSLDSRLQELCSGDEELYHAMSRLMFLDPGKIVSPVDTVLREAQDYEAKGNKLRAEVGYRIAGGISLYKGDTEGVRKYFLKASSFAGDARPEYNILAKRADDAIGVARKYYGNSDPGARV